MLITKRSHPFLSDEEITILSTNPEEANTLNAKRYEEVQNKVNQNFVSLARDSKTFAEKKSADIKDQLERYSQTAKGDATLALDMFLYNNASFRSELNRLRPDAPISYLGMAYSAGDAEYNRYVDEEKAYSIRATAESSTTPGLGNTVQTTVSQSIMYRVDNFNPIVSLVTKINLPYGDYDATHYNNYGVASYMTENNNVPDNTTNFTDATNGIKKTSFSAKQFGVSFARSWLAEKRISPTVINQLLTFTEQEIGRGEALQIMIGSGVGLNDNGIVNVATPATVGGNVLETSSNAVAQVEKVNDRSGLVFVMNSDAYNEFRLLTLVNTVYKDTINLNNNTLWGIPVVVVGQTIMPTTVGVAKVVVGNFNKYIKFTNGGLDKIDLTNFNNASTTSLYLMARDGGAVFADSFSVFNVTV